MRSHLITRLAGICAIVLVALVFAARQAESQTDGDGSTRWQHLSVTHEAQKGIGDAELGRRIVQLGADGWELVDVTTLVRDGSTTHLVFCFKRPK